MEKSLLLIVTLSVLFLDAGTATAGCRVRDLMALVRGDAFRKVPPGRLEAVRAEIGRLRNTYAKGEAALRSGYYWRFTYADGETVPATREKENWQLGRGVIGAMTGVPLVLAGVSGESNPILISLATVGSASIGTMMSFVIAGSQRPLRNIVFGPITYPYRLWRRGGNWTLERLGDLSVRIRALEQEERDLLGPS